MLSPFSTGSADDPYGSCCLDPLEPSFGVLTDSGVLVAARARGDPVFIRRQHVEPSGGDFGEPGLRVERANVFAGECEQILNPDLRHGFLTLGSTSRHPEDWCVRDDSFFVDEHNKVEDRLFRRKAKMLPSRGRDETGFHLSPIDLVRLGFHTETVGFFVPQDNRSLDELFKMSREVLEKKINQKVVEILSAQKEEQRSVGLSVGQLSSDSLIRRLTHAWSIQTGTRGRGVFVRALESSSKWGKFEVWRPAKTHYWVRLVSGSLFRVW